MINQTNTCPNCGTNLKHTLSNYITTNLIACPNCSTVHYVDETPINWTKITNDQEQ